MTDFTTVKKNLESKRFRVSAFATAEEAADYLDRSIDGVSVGIGGSVTAEQMGLYEKLSGHNRVFWHWRPESAEDPRREAMTADMYITSVNGMAETGELINIDGNGNRVGPLCYGPEHVLVVAGMNKVVTDIHEGVKRIRAMACPANAIRLGRRTPCAVAGVCGDCKGPESMCSQLVIVRRCQFEDRIKVILVGEELGF